MNRRGSTEPQKSDGYNSTEALQAELAHERSERSAVELSLDRMRPSIGIALYPDDAATSASLLEHADVAMYAAKRQQIGYSFFDATVRGQASAAATPGSVVAS